MATNQYLPFATGGGANVLAYADYQSLAARTAGFAAGTALSVQLNTAWRQASIGTAMLGQFVGDIGGFNALDDGSVTNLLTSFERTIQNSKINYAIAGGTANALTAALVPAPATLTAGLRVRLLLTLTNTAAATFNLNGLGAKNIFIDGANATRPGDLVSGAVVELTYDGTQWQLMPTDGSVRNSAASTGGTTVTLSTGSGNFTVPANIYALQVQIAGAGGGGGYAASGGANAGGNGADVVFGRLAVTPGQVIAYSVGAAGSGGNSGTTAQAGGDTTFGTWVAKGGTAPPNVGAVAGSPATGAAGSTGPTVIAGQQASAGLIITTAPAQQRGGVGGQSYNGGFGGNGANSGATAGNVGAKGGGGGGGGSNASNGGNGGSGLITISY